MIGDLAGSRQVTVELTWVHKQDVAGVGEALAAAAVGLELPPEAKVAARQVADGGVVLGVGEPPERDISGIAGVGLDGRPQPGSEPAEEGLAVGGSQFARLPRWHAGRLDLLADGLPGPEVAGQVGGGKQPVEGHGPLRVVTGMAVEAVGPDDFQGGDRISRDAAGSGAPDEADGDSKGGCLRHHKN